MATKKRKGKRTRKAKKSDAPKTPAERDDLLAFITDELIAPNNIKVDIDFTDPKGNDEELNRIITKKKIKRDKVGRPLSMTIPTLRKLKMAYLIDCTDTEACGYAGIGTTALYDFQKKHPEFTELKAKWKETYIMAARMNVVKEVMKKKSIDDSWKVLRAKRKHEYAEKHIVDDKNVMTVEELEEIANGDIKEIKD